jgi:thioredoxin-related protein
MLATPGLRVRATPTLVLVDRQGRIVDAWEGAGKIDTRLAIRAAIDALPR